MSSDIYNLTFITIDGSPLPLSTYKRQVLLLVNTASKCSYTGQYAGLQKLYETYSAQGFTVIGMPCNDFGRQEPACPADIKQFTHNRFSVTFPLTDKVTTKGENAHSFFKQMRAQFGIFGVPHWNFYKYVIGRDGLAKTWYSPLTKPTSPKLIRVIENVLAEKLS